MGIEQIKTKADAEMAMQMLNSALLTLMMSKPTDRTEVARYWAVTITDMEKVVAYFKTYVAEPAGAV